MQKNISLHFHACNCFLRNIILCTYSSTHTSAVLLMYAARGWFSTWKSSCNWISTRDSCCLFGTGTMTSRTSSTRRFARSTRRSASCSRTSWSLAEATSPWPRTTRRNTSSECDDEQWWHFFCVQNEYPRVFCYILTELLVLLLQIVRELAFHAWHWSSISRLTERF